MTRESSDRIDNSGITKDGFDYALQVWVEEYIIQDVGAGRHGLAGKDIRTVPGHSIRCPSCGTNISSLVSRAKSDMPSPHLLPDGSVSDEIIEATARVILFWWHLFERAPVMGRLIKSINRSDYDHEK
ncbi:MAG: hypothetical protein PHV74_13895 [Dehalococcoidia bacterium]|nr:hypothetical protein [Dehalococcoidia bacterium]